MSGLDDKITKAKQRVDTEKELKKKGQADLFGILGITPEPPEEIDLPPEDDGEPFDWTKVPRSDEERQKLEAKEREPIQFVPGVRPAQEGENNV